MLEVDLIAAWTLKKLQEYLCTGTWKDVDAFLFEWQPLHYLVICWAEPSELATLLSQCAKQTLALVEGAALLSPQKYEQMTDILLFWIATMS